jgi:carotenoid cleavage dioxygenase-like enzyme
MYDKDNPFLSGNYAPWREEGDAFDLEIEGELPRELDGALCRIGPNPQFPPSGRYHWFDGDGMVHAIIMHGGRAAYRNRWVRTAGLLTERKAGRALFGGLLAMPKEVPPEGPFKNAANTNLIGYAGSLLALWEGGLPHQLGLETLETVGPFNFCDRLNGPMTAHPKFDPSTGDLLFFGYQPFPPYVTYHRADPNGNLIESQPIDSGLPVMMHDFVTTPNYAVFFVCPSVFRLENIAKGLPPLAWEPDQGVRIGAMHRVTKEIRWLHTDPFYVFHFLNAFEEGGKIVVDACRLASLDMTGNSFGPPPLAHRFTLDFTAGTVKAEQIDDQPSEFPRIDGRLNGLKHRLGYFAGSRPGARRSGIGFEMLIKRDYRTGRSEVLDLGAHMAPSEPVFVPRSKRSNEDEGYVMAVWYNAQTDRSEVTVSDAANFTGVPIARIKLNHRVPFGFHGNWIDSAARSVDTQPQMPLQGASTRWSN